jgi:segregation and condensation protein A
LEGVKVTRTPVYELTLYELLRTYGDHKSKGTFDPLEIAPTAFYSVDDALERLGAILGKIPDWTILQGFLPDSAEAGLFFKSAVASTFAASLELAKTGQLEIRQTNKFGPIYVRSRAETG